MNEHDLLDEQVVSQGRHLQHVKRWWRGVHPDRGCIVRGWTGWETLEEADRILPIHTFHVVANGPRG
jgi:hypothetical protein